MQNLNVESGQSSARCGEDSFSVKAVGAGKGRGAVACRAVRGQGWAALCLWVQPSLHFSAAFQCCVYRCFFISLFEMPVCCFSKSVTAAAKRTLCHFGWLR